MIIYKHEYSSGSRRIRTYKHEAEEKTKIYIVDDRSRVLKADIGKIKGCYFKEMWTFSPDTTGFIQALIEDNADRIEVAERKLKELEDESVMLLTELAKKGRSVAE